MIAGTNGAGTTESASEYSESGFKTEQWLSEANGITAVDQHFNDASGFFTLNLIEDLHGFNDADDGVSFDNGAHSDEGRVEIGRAHV